MYFDGHGLCFLHYLTILYDCYNKSPTLFKCVVFLPYHYSQDKSEPDWLYILVHLLKVIMLLFASFSH